MGRALDKESLDLFRAFGRRYGPLAGEEGPLRLVQEVFGAKPDPWQEQVLRWYANNERRVSIRSCHGVGKTAVAAWLVWCNLLTRFPQKTILTAPSSGQIEGALWPEILKWGDKLPPAIRQMFTFKALKIELTSAPANSFFEARTSRAEKPEALQGIHCTPGYVLLICDEASGIPDPVFEAAGGSMSDPQATTVLIGNPTRTSGLFFDSHNTLSSIWKTIRVGYKESSRVSEDYVRQVSLTYGENSNEFRVRCLGEFPLSDSDTIIPWDFVHSARARLIDDPPGAPCVWGLDVARYGSDRTCLVSRSARAVRWMEVWERKDTMETVGRVKAKWDHTPDSHRPHTIVIDAIGIGAGVADRLREMGLPAIALNVSENASLKGMHRNLRSELYWDARDWLAKKDVKLPAATPGADPREDPPELLAKELTLIKYKYMSDGRLLVQSKDDVRSANKGASPDLADAFILTFAEDTLVAGGWGSYGGSSGDLPTRQIGIV